MSAEVETLLCDCCVCGSNAGSILAEGWDFEYATSRQEFRFIRCYDCGHTYLNPRPAASALEVIYPKNYYAYDLKKSVSPVALRVKGWLERRKMSAMLRLSAENHPRCLDIGCGDGRLLEVLHSLGVPKDKLFGVELSEKIIRELCGKGIKGYCGRIEELNLPENSFDLIYMFQVIEHVENPAALLAAVQRVLAPGGLFILETPNVESLDALVFKRRYWGGYHFPRHWNLFSRKTVSQLGEKMGYQVEKVETFVCAVFWIYPFHHFLRDKGFSPRLYRFFWPMNNPFLLAIGTMVDLFLLPFGLTSNLRVVLRKQRS